MESKTNNKSVKRPRLSFGKPIVLFVPLVGLLFVPTITKAGVISDIKQAITSTISSIFGQEASAQTANLDSSSSTNSQNMDLPEPVNNIDPTLKAGTEAVIEGGEALLPEVGPSNKAPEEFEISNGLISTYVVRSGDTVSGIANMFGVSANTVLWANDLPKGSALKAGQTLVILPISGIIHTVVSGDTLQSITKKYNGNLDEIASFNDLVVTDILHVGETIIIPDGEAPVSSPSSAKSSVSRVSGTGVTKLIPGTASGPNLSGYFAKPFPDSPNIWQTQGLHGYNSVDYRMPVGTPLSAAAPGTVIISKNSGWNGGYGNYVVIQHSNGTQTVYGHMTRTVVTVGQVVSRGELIGYSGNSGNSTGPHLHLEVRGAKNPFNHM